jgi:hypothetical protein
MLAFGSCVAVNRHGAPRRGERNSEYGRRHGQKVSRDAIPSSLRTVARCCAPAARVAGRWLPRRARACAVLRTTAATCRAPGRLSPRRATTRPTVIWRRTSSVRTRRLIDHAARALRRRISGRKRRNYVGSRNWKERFGILLLHPALYSARLVVDVQRIVRVVVADLDAGRCLDRSATTDHRLAALARRHDQRRLSLLRRGREI